MGIGCTHMTDLLVVACTWVPRNFTWTEWGSYMKDNEEDYRPTCPNAPIPPDAIAAIQDAASQQIRAGQVVSATQQLDQLNGWLQVNGQFKSFGVDVSALVVEVVATATAEAMPTSTFIPTPSATYIPQQPVSPLGVQQTSPLSSPTLTPESSVTPTSPLSCSMI